VERSGGGRKKVYLSLEMKSARTYNTATLRIVERFFEKNALRDGYLWLERMDVCDEKARSRSTAWAPKEILGSVRNGVY
jgi:hypothetical protein